MLGRFGGIFKTDYNTLISRINHFSLKIFKEHVPTPTEHREQASQTWPSQQYHNDLVAAGDLTG